MKQILLIPDVHCRPGSDLSYLRHIGQLAVEKKPDIILQIGDFADMPSLSSYDVGKKAFEGRRYISDIASAIEGMEYLLGPIKEYNYRFLESVGAPKVPKDHAEVSKGTWLSYREAAVVIESSERSVTRWADLYRDFLALRKNVRRANEISEESLDVLKAVKRLLGRGRLASGIYSALLGEGFDRVGVEYPKVDYEDEPAKEAEELPTGCYNPRKVMTLGNHDGARILRAINDDPKLEGTIGIDDLKYREFGWEVHPFLEVIDVEGIMFSHYFTSGVMGRPVSSARSLLQKKHASCVMGHVQHRDIAYSYTADGRELVGLFCGTAYNDHHEYLGLQGQNHFRGVWILKNVEGGTFEPVAYTLDELERRYTA